VRGLDTARGPRFSNASLVHEAAIDGLGVALALRPLVDSDIDEGRLVVPFSYEAPTRFAYYLVIPEVLEAHPAVEAFRGWLKAEAAGQKRETKRRG
jgi:LysR family glycine cleavage system transcriptional activator